MRVYRISCFLIALFLGLELSAQELNQLVITEKGDTMLLGACNRKGLAQAPFQAWFQENYHTYTPNEALLRRSQSQWERRQGGDFHGHLVRG